MRKLLLCFVVAACGGGATGDEAMIEKSVVVAEKLANAIDSAKGDCSKMASGLEALLKDHASDIEQVRALKEKYKDDKAGKEKLKAAAEKFKPRMAAITPKLLGVTACKDDPKMKELNDKMRAAMGR